MKDGQMEIQTEQNEGRTDRDTDRQNEGRTDRQNEGRTDGDTDRQNEGRTDRDTDRQTDDPTDGLLVERQRSDTHTDEEQTDGRNG